MLFCFSGCLTFACLPFLCGFVLVMGLIVGTSGVFFAYVCFGLFVELVYGFCWVGLVFWVCVHVNLLVCWVWICLLCVVLLLCGFLVFDYLCLGWWF